MARPSKKHMRLELADPRAADKFARWLEGNFGRCFGTYVPVEHAETTRGRFTTEDLPHGTCFAFVDDDRRVVYGRAEATKDGYVSSRLFTPEDQQGHVEVIPVERIQAILSVREWAYCADHGWPQDSFAAFCVVNGASP